MKCLKLDYQNAKGEEMKKNLNAIPKSKRPKKRYLLLNKDIDKNKLINYSITLYGVVNTSKFGIKKIKENIIKVDLPYVDYVISAINYIGIKTKDPIKVIAISGTIKGLLNKIKTK